MTKLKYFVRTSVLGGAAVVLPVGILVLTTWLFGLVTRMVRPVTLFLQTKFPDVDFFQLELLADAVIVVALLAVCFVVGISVRTRVGRFVHESLENWILRVAPGYGLIKETVLQFLGHGASPFSQVALVSVYANGARATAFITDEHEDGSYTVFIPTDQIRHQVAFCTSPRSMLSCSTSPLTKPYARLSLAVQGLSRS